MKIKVQITRLKDGRSEIVEAVKLIHMTWGIKLELDNGLWEVYIIEDYEYKVIR